MILITGVAGFIGFNLAKYLIQQGETVVGVDFLEDLGYNNNIKLDRLKELGISRIEIGKITKSSKFDSFEFSYVEINDKKRMKELFIEFQFKTVIHLAALTGVRLSEIYPDKFINVNIQGFNTVLELSKEYAVDKFMYASSSSIYGLSSDSTKNLLSENSNSDVPMSIYATTKKSNELIAHTYTHNFNMKTIGMRFFSVYGPWGRPDSAIYIFTKNIIENKPITLHNKGNMIRDFTYIDDAVKSIYLLSKNNNINLYKIYNIGNSKPIKLMDFVSEIENNLNKIATKEYVGKRLSNMVYSGANTDELYQDINFKPSTSYQIGISNFINWYLKYNLKNL